jgi:hypothetical protein
VTITTSPWSPSLSSSAAGEAYLLAYGKYRLYYEEEDELQGVLSATDLYSILTPATHAKLRVPDAGVERDGYKLYLIVEIEMWIGGEKVEPYASGS